MSTSLSQQLQRLSVPQAGISFADAHSRASILFDPKEAATKDRRTIYDIGVEGLQQLISLNPHFKQFESTLFDEATINLERAVEHIDVNKLLDKNITKFLRHLSPYFLLRPAHMCLEWLLRRFCVHQYNRDEIMALILPYHETNMFVQLLKTMRIKSNDAEWAWLRPLQKPGVPLCKSAIINRAANTPSFLDFVCRTTLHAVKEFGARANHLQTQLNFYTTVVIGALQNARVLEEWHISTVLDSLLKGLSSDTVDFVSSAYIIVAQLVARSKLKPKLCNAVVERVANCTFERLRTTALLLLIWIFDTQTSAEPEFTKETLLNLIRQKWLTQTVASLAKENVATEALCKPLLHGAVLAVQDAHPESIAFKLFLDRFLVDVELSMSSAEKLIVCFLDAYKPPSDVIIHRESNPFADGDIIELDSDDDIEIPAPGGIQAWYSGYLFKLERKYPKAFDNAIKIALQSQKESPNRRKAVRLALGFRLKSSNENDASIYESLYHFNPDIRLHAVQRLLHNIQHCPSQSHNYQMLKDCLADRVNDDSERVVARVLQFPTEDFVKILGAESFCDALFKVLQKTELSPNTWRTLAKLALEHLTSKPLVESCDKNLIVLELMPILFPSDDGVAIGVHHIHSAIQQILSSEFSQAISFLKMLKICDDYEKFDVQKFKQDLVDAIAMAKDTLDPQDLLLSVENRGGVAYFKSAAQLTHLIMLLTPALKCNQPASVSLKILIQIKKYSSQFEFNQAATDKKFLHQTCVPHQVYADFLLTLVHNTDFGNLLLWPTEPTDGLLCVLNILKLLTNAVFERNPKPETHLAWKKLLKECLDGILTTAQNKIDFLLNFFVHAELPKYFNEPTDYAVLRLHAIKLFQALLQNKNNEFKLSTAHVLRIACGLAATSLTMRLQTLETLKQLAKHGSSKLEKHTVHFLTSLNARGHELSMDHEQYALILYTILQPTKPSVQQKVYTNKLQKELLQLICDDSSPLVLSAELLKAVRHVNNEAILSALLPLVHATLQRTTQLGNLTLLPEPMNTIHQLIVERFDSQNISNVLSDQSLAWKLFEVSFAAHNVYTTIETKLQPLPCVILNTLTPECYESMPDKYKLSLLQLIIKTVAVSDNDSIFLAAHKLFKKCIVDCRPLVANLTHMHQRPSPAPTVGGHGIQRTQKRNKPLSVGSSSSSGNGGESGAIDLHSDAWRQGIALLELLEQKKHLSGSEHLIPPLFDLLKACLELDEQSAVEYPKQLILSTLLHCCQNAQVRLQTALPETSFRIEQIVQCLRATQNPQTQRNALLLLAHCATLYPQQVLHNVVAIFTFMGSSLVRHDDAFSFHIINNIIESIVPILIAQQEERLGKTPQLVVPVLKVFSDILLDVPEHRRLPLYTKLLETLGPVQHLWQFLCVVFEAYVIEDEKQRLLQQKSKLPAKQPGKAASTNSGKRLEFAQELTLIFAPTVIIETCVSLLDYLKTLPASAEKKATTAAFNTIDSNEAVLFDAKCRSSKQLRHYKYVTMQYLSAISGAAELTTKVAALPDAELMSMKPYYQNFIIKTLSYVAVANNALKATTEPSQIKFWKVILHHVHDVLDNAISLLLPEMFLIVVNGLMKHGLLSVRKKVIELLITKLQQEAPFFNGCGAEQFATLFETLTDIIEGILLADSASTGTAGNELLYMQQTALIAIKLLSKVFGVQYISEFKALLLTLTKIAKKRANISKVVVATVVLTLVEVSSNLKAHSLAQLPKFMPQVVEILREQLELVQQQPPDNVCLAIVSAVQKLFEALPLFLGPYIVDIITTLASISSQLKLRHADKEERVAPVQQKISVIWDKIASEVPVRILVPSAEQSYQKMITAHSYNDIGALMKLLLASIKHNNNAELQGVQHELSELFLHALEFRLHMRKKSAHQKALSPVNIAEIESHTIDAFVAWILRLSESTFRPMYNKVYDWAIKRTAQKETILTYFLLNNKIAEALKSLFVLFANDFIEDAARLLNECNTLKEDINVNEDSLCVELIEAVLRTLYQVFLHNSKEFVNAHRFNTLMTPIVDQLENRLVLEHENLQHVLQSCISQLAVAVSSDILWKQLNNEVLLKTRNNVPEVRIHAFNCCVEVARKLGEDFTPLLPETVPFIAELFEDENSRVEKNTRKSVQELETILGESLQKYL